MKTLAAGLAGLMLTSLALADHHMEKEGDHSGPQKAICLLVPTAGSEVSGYVMFEETDGKVRVTGEVTGLTPNAKHGFHIHEFGDLRDMKEGKSLGGHFAHGGDKHGKPSDPAEERHTGDLGNIQADGEGVAKIDISDTVIDLHGVESILGRGVVVHKGEDKFTQPTGDAGGRAAIGVIGVAKTE